MLRIDDGDGDIDREISIDGLMITGGNASGNNFRDGHGGGGFIIRNF